MKQVDFHNYSFLFHAMASSVSNHSVFFKKWF
jgi:hypothetical protein